MAVHSTIVDREKNEFEQRKNTATLADVQKVVEKEQELLYCTSDPCIGSSLLEEQVDKSQERLGTRNLLLEEIIIFLYRIKSMA